MKRSAYRTTCSRLFSVEFFAITLKYRSEKDLLLPSASDNDVLAPAQDEAGFTFIELLVATTIIFVLASLAIQSFFIYREDAYHSLAQQMMQQTRTSMEAGKIDSESFDSNLFFVSTDAGPAEALDGPDIVPSLVLPDNFYVYVFHNPACSVAGCIEDYVITRHCRINQRVVYWKSYRVGESTVMNSVAPGDC
jgi:type II secretory pathway pseudopilin PulG